MVEDRGCLDIARCLYLLRLLLVIVATSMTTTTCLSSRENASLVVTAPTWHDHRSHAAISTPKSEATNKDSKTASSTELATTTSTNLSAQKSCLTNNVEDLPCLPLCCPWKQRVEHNKCVESNDTENVEFPSSSSIKIDRNNYRFFVWDPCNGTARYRLKPDESTNDVYLVLENGSIYQTVIGKIIGVNEYCFGIVDPWKYDVLLCFDVIDNYYDDYDENGTGTAVSVKKVMIYFPISMIISVPFLMATFLVYTILPELKNMHGHTLRGYVGSLIVAYVVLAAVQTTPQEMISDGLCITIAFIIHYSFLASFFWLNVMCFDIWWTFGGFRSLRGTVKQMERKKFIIYSIYAWGCASILTGVCLIMDFVPTIPKTFIRPEFGRDSCWFYTNDARAIYFYGPMSVTVFCNICLFISTAFKIVQHKKDTAHHLKGSESRRHDHNKQWFNLYLKLFIVMGINWSMEIISWLFNGKLQYLWYATDLANTLQGVIIFVIFVWKDRIKCLLWKRFGCHGTSVLSRNSTRSIYHSSTSRTFTTSATPFQENVNIYTRPGSSYRTKDNVDESDCT